MGQSEAYEDAFWGSEFSSQAGFDVLVKRHHDNKKTLQEFEDYLKKRSKMEQEYSKTMSGLTKCFRPKQPVGQLENAINQLRCELDGIASSHLGASQFFARQADGIKKLREEQSTRAKQAEDALQKAQQSKLSQLAKTIQAEKTFQKKHMERDHAENSYKDALDLGTTVQKELDKAQNRAEKAEAEAQKSDNAYRSAVFTLDNCRQQWEIEMVKASQVTQQLDEERIRKLREELWVAANVDSKTALETDNICENIRLKLENCSIQEDMLEFIKVASTGTKRPEPFEYKPYNRKPNETKPKVHRSFNPYCDIDLAESVSESQDPKTKFQTLPKPVKPRVMLPKMSSDS